MGIDLYSGFRVAYGFNAARALPRPVMPSAFPLALSAAPSEA